MRGKDIPRDFPKRSQLFPDLEEWFKPGNSVIVSPGGRGHLCPNGRLLEPKPSEPAVCARMASPGRYARAALIPYSDPNFSRT